MNKEPSLMTVSLYCEDQVKKRARIIILLNFQIPREFAMSTYLEGEYLKLVNGETAASTVFQNCSGRYGVSIAERNLREEAVRQGFSNLALEGFDIDPVVIVLNERFIAGELSLKEKFQHILTFYESVRNNKKQKLF